MYSFNLRHSLDVVSRMSGLPSRLSVILGTILFSHRAKGDSPSEITGSQQTGSLLPSRPHPECCPGAWNPDIHVDAAHHTCLESRSLFSTKVWQIYIPQNVYFNQVLLIVWCWSRVAEMFSWKHGPSSGVKPTYSSRPHNFGRNIALRATETSNACSAQS